VPVNTSWVGLYEKIDGLVKGIIINIKNDTVLTADQEALVTTVKVPLHRYLSVISASSNLTGQAESLANSYTELIAQDIINRNLLAILGRIESDVVGLPNNLRDTEVVNEYLTSLKGTMKAMQAKQKESDISITQLFEMHDRIHAWEKALVAHMDPRLLSVILYSMRE
jgi:hypothetical protein